MTKTMPGGAGLRSLALGALWAAGLALSAGAQDGPPMLQDQVDGGSLPPMAERLPSEPKVLTPFKEEGQYGGELNFVMRGPADTGTLFRTIGYENLTRYVNWQPDTPGEDIVPDVEMNVAKSVDVSDDGTEYTFHLREGMKWSDGEPYTADDIMFWYDHVYSNTELFPTKPRWSMSGDTPMTVEKIDDYTVAFKFAEPNGLLLTWLATPASQPFGDNANRPTTYPAHYLQQFHPDFNPDAEAQAEAAGAQGWVDRFHAKADAFRNPEKPTLHAWVVTQAVGEGSGEQVMAVRNPYYFKTDDQGRQLPYIDRVVVDVIADPEVTLLRAASGTYDFLDSYIGFVATPENKGTLYDNQERGGYHFYEVLPNRSNLNILSLNITSQNPAKREMFGNKTFREALSIAIDRPEIIELVYLGQGRPYQVVERPESPLFDEEMATQFTDYDPDKANQMLDEMGYDKRDSDGIRLGPDGKPIQITVDIAVVRRPWLDAAELIRGYWKKIGVDLIINTMEVTALNQRVHANEHDATVWSASGGADTLFDPKYFLPFSENSFYAVPWGKYYSGQAGAEEPPEAAKKQQELYSQLLESPDQETRIDLFKQIVQIAKEQFWSLGLMQPSSDYGIVANNLHNMPEVLMASTNYTHPGAANPEQWFFSDQ